MQPTDTQIRRLIRVCRERLGNPKGLAEPDTYPDGLALCIIDSIQSVGATYANVNKVVTRYRAYRRAQGGDPETDGAVGLLGTFHDLGSADRWAGVIGNSGRMSSNPDAPLKAVVIESAASALSDIELYSAADLREVVTYPDLTATVQDAWTAAVGGNAGLTWRNLLVVAGVPGVKPDRTLIRFIASGLGLEQGSIPPEFAVDAIERTAAGLAVSPTALDSAAWRWQRAR